jgi:hypothetical protein
MQSVVVVTLQVMIGYSTLSRTKANEPCSMPQAVVLMDVTIWAICSVIQSMTSVMGYPMMVSRGLADMMRLTVV